MNQLQQKSIIGYLSEQHAEKIGIFGSYARGEQNEYSDLDLLVSFSDSKTLLDLVRIERELSELLGVKVDLLTEGALKNEKLRRYIMQDIQYILQ